MSNNTRTKSRTSPRRILFCMNFFCHFFEGVVCKIKSRKEYDRLPMYFPLVTHESLTNERKDSMVYKFLRTLLVLIYTETVNSPFSRRTRPLFLLKKKRLSMLKFRNPQFMDSTEFQRGESHLFVICPKED